MRRLLAPLALSAAFAALSCSRPEPPRLTPEHAKITSITPAGIALELRLDAYNPNSIPLSTRALTAKVTLDGKPDAGDVHVPTPLALPAGKHTKIEVPITIKWTGVAGLVGLAASGRDIPYVIDGTVEIGGDALHVSVPFRMASTVTHDELTRAGMSSLPSLKIPGLP